MQGMKIVRRFKKKPFIISRHRGTDCSTSPTNPPQSSFGKACKKIVFWTFFPIIVGIGLFLLLTGWCYFTCPVYTFEEPEPFSGKQFYNPYQTITGDSWQKCVFHLHTKSWFGLTNGENTYEEMINAYRQLNYDVIAVSNYMKINRNKTDGLLFIPAYEHGYSVKKTHQLALGTWKVVWRDYFFPQNLSQKQHIIDKLKDNSHFVAVNHPTMRSSYRPDDFKYLSGYDFLEVQNGTHLSEAAWDTALSSGRRAWLIANDDAHSASPERLQREVTFIHVPVNVDSVITQKDEQLNLISNILTPKSYDLLYRLQHGIAFGVHFPRKVQPTMEDKIKEANAVSFPTSIQVLDDTLHVVWQQTMQKIEFIGDRGKLLKAVSDSDSASYPIRPQDSYVRVKLTSPEGLVYYLNPVVRYGDNQQLPESRIDTAKTYGKRLLGVLFVGILFLLMVKIKC